ncbi:sialidase family protein [Paenibacillus oceani]|uniref:Exo-alpha-sialidase n=1 Tax=Paenibacillus oceani TaxID=2772510 RepID=A0A927H3K8_9BACL|nr:sialidase family protein [Paenibacillus oceani]MBD2865594.1 exo-alpha-sialidase [Paenibacillus oceani]
MATLRKIRDVVIYRDACYNSFPNVARMSNGDLLVAFRHAADWQTEFGRVQHIDPGSIALIVRSRDEGSTWSEPSVLHDDYLYGVQDPCLNVLGDGTVLATCFLWKVAEIGEVDEIGERSGYTRQIGDRYAAKRIGIVTKRSTDNGKTWDRAASLGYGQLALRGNGAELPDGSFLVAAYTEGLDHLFVAKTTDKGLSWSPQGAIAKPADNFLNETHLYRTESGKLVAFIRSQIQDERLPAEKRSPLFTSESFDDGRTWSEPQQHAVYGPTPFHTIRLASGRVLLTYGYRLKPHGLRARLLDPECKRIEEADEIVLRDDGPGMDIGYSHAVQLPDGRILIVYYFYDRADGRRYIAGTWCEEI